MNQFDRREFLKFLGISGIALTNTTLLGSLTSCDNLELNSIPALQPSFKDDLLLSKGLSYKKIISWGDQINKSEVFGFNNDYIALEPLTEEKLLMWVNHEYVHPLFVSGMERTKENVDKERRMVGGSIIEINKVNDEWKFNPKSEFNKGVRGDTKIPFNLGVKIKGQNFAEGTNSNCAGGKTPWGTFLTCEENYDFNYGERDLETGKVIPSEAKWELFYPNPPEHYGWVVEIDPKTAQAKKHTSIGRFAHECATCIVSKSGNAIVYSADDKNDEHIYKFISESSDNLDKGKLYVADTINGKWLSLDINDSPELKKHFKNQLEIQTYTRKAAKLVGGTPLDRPEDIEIHPITGDVYITLTNNKPKKIYHGSILKISEQNQLHNALEFKAETFIFGGEKSGISCPDNLAFDQNGNLWMVNDISGFSIGNEIYKKFGNNGLFVIPTSGANAGIPVQVGSAPVDAELTGLCFSPDYKTLFLSVQHPGETTKDLKKPTSHWPNGGMPKPTVVAITGPLLEVLTQKKS